MGVFSKLKNIFYDEEYIDEPEAEIKKVDKVVKKEVEEGIRNKFYDIIEESLKNCGEDYDVLRVPISIDSTSKSYRLAIPTCDSERNDVTAIISVNIVRPNQKREEEYDCYDEHERWKENCERG